MENWLQSIQPDLDVEISPALSCLLLQIILRAIGNSNFNSHTFEGWWLAHYPWWKSQPTINMYFQAKNHHSFLLSDNLRQKSYLLWLECSFCDSNAQHSEPLLLLWLRIGLCLDWHWVAAVFWTAISIGVSSISMSFGRSEGEEKERKVALREQAIFASLKQLNLLSLILSVMLI